MKDRFQVRPESDQSRKRLLPYLIIDTHHRNYSSKLTRHTATDPWVTRTYTTIEQANAYVHGTNRQRS